MPSPRSVRFREDRARFDDYPLDGNGFFRASGEVVGVPDLLTPGITLVLAPPWMGKTYVATWLERFLALEPINEDTPRPYGGNIKLLRMERHAYGSRLWPDWWETWRLSGGTACWIVDGLDEGETHHPKIGATILEGLKSLGQTRRRGLCAILFCREAEVPEEVEEILGEPWAADIRIADLMPMDSSSALDFLRGEGLGQAGFDRAVDLIRRCDLQHVARFPAALRYLARQEPGVRLDDVDVWRGVLQELLLEHNRSRLQSPPAHIEDLFLATQRIAAVLSFSGTEVIGDGISDAQPTVDQAISPSWQVGGDLREAAFAALRSDAFRRVADGYAFCQKSVREWMCAFHVSGYSLDRLRPLVCGALGEPRPEHLGLLALLHHMSSDEGVKAWLSHQFGGVPPRSDQSPWGLRDAMLTIDRLEAIVQQTTWAVSVWGDWELDRLSVDGLGDALAVRIADRKRLPSVRRLLLDIAVATGSTATVPAAIRIVADNREPSYLRRVAADVVTSLGTPSEAQGLAGFAKSSSPRDENLNHARATLIQFYVEHGAWSRAEAVLFAPPTRPNSIDASYMLLSHLSESLTVADAKQLVADRRFKWLKITSRRERKLSRRDREIEVQRKVLTLVAEQEEPADNELRVMVRMALRFDDYMWAYDVQHLLEECFKKSRAFRRDLYRRELARAVKSATAGKRIRRDWPHVLMVEDLDWLTGLIVRLGISADEVFNDAFLLGYQAGATRAHLLNARRFVRTHRPDLLSTFDRNRKKHAAKRRKWARRDERRKEEKEKQRVSIADAVSGVLMNRRMSLQRRMWSLSWLCFSDDGWRPENLDGKWGDLPDAMQQEVLAVCGQALVDTAPTPVPSSNTFPSVVAYEGQCFCYLVRNPSASFHLNGELIVKWLPSVFKGTFGSRDAILDACRQVDPVAAEAAILAQIRAEGEAEEPHWMCAENLGRSFWTTSFVAEVKEIICDESINDSYRADALRALRRSGVGSDYELVEQLARRYRGVTLASSRVNATALSSWLESDVDGAWPVFEEHVAREGKTALESIGMFGIGTEKRGFLKEWPAEKLEALAVLLHKHYPASEDPKEIPRGLVTSRGAYGLRQLREEIPEVLFRRSSPGAFIALEALSARYPGVRRQYDYFRANAGVMGVLGYASRGRRLANVGCIPPPSVPEVLASLERADFRIVRTSGELLMVLVEALNRIGRNAAEHLPMLYTKRTGNQGTRKAETALQAYVACRLRDLLPDRILEREPEVQFRRRPDIQVHGQTHDGGRIAVVIEAKWSDHQDLSTALADQLGRKYLLEGNQTHGIYLVGWTGRPVRWKRDAEHAPQNRASLQDLENSLAAQAADVQCKHPNIRIQPVVLDLSWHG